MSTQNIIRGPITRVGNREYCKGEDGLQWQRKVGSPDDQWKLVEIPPEEHDPLLLMLVLEKQFEGEPLHWSLFVAREGKPGMQYQVAGDASDMYYSPIENVNAITSDWYSQSFVLAQLDDAQAERVLHFSETEVPPHAGTETSVEENSQSWVLRVLRNLQIEKIVDHHWIDYAATIKEPVR